MGRSHDTRATRQDYRHWRDPHRRSGRCGGRCSGGKRGQLRAHGDGLDGVGIDSHGHGYRPVGPHRGACRGEPVQLSLAQAADAQRPVQMRIERGRGKFAGLLGSSGRSGGDRAGKAQDRTRQSQHADSARQHHAGTGAAARGQYRRQFAVDRHIRASAPAFRRLQSACYCPPPIRDSARRAERGVSMSTARGFAKRFCWPSPRNPDSDQAVAVRCDGVPRFRA